MARRRLDPPPLPNAAYMSHLGSGGFADVFLYKQDIPQRNIAVKVLRHEATSEQNVAFEAEANLMASMSAHPSILSVYGAGVSSDGRPYLMMEYCPPPNLGQRARKRPLPVPRVLDMGIRIAGAVETLHRANILHRDIKPSNILITQFGHPVLTDFGVAVATDQTKRLGGGGFSIPWASPEQQNGVGPFSPAMDVYSLSATIYTMLTGRSPFEIPGGDNSEVALLSRVLRSPVPSIGRQDVPEELERVLSIGMSKDPSHRYPSAMDLAIALQHVQADMHQRPTHFDVLETESVLSVTIDDEDRTRARPLLAIDLRQKAAERHDPTPTPEAATSPATPPAAPPPLAEPHEEKPQAGVYDVPQAPPASTQKPTSGTSPAPVETTSDRRHYASPPAIPHLGAQVEEVTSASRSGEDTSQIWSTQTGTLPDESLVFSTRGNVEPRKLSYLSRGLVGALLIALSALAGWGIWATIQGTLTPSGPTDQEPSFELPVEETATPVTGLRGEVTDTGVRFTWDRQDGEVIYLFRVSDPLEEHQVRRTRSPEATVDPVKGRTCLEVVVVPAKGAGKNSAPVVGCVETP
ncbi:serine/threonine-protein kinase [Schaalia canis]|uniref:non-specific serine/threonine protein kinase n=1 Tax=Schaalia canis TaxID=100469 RepID=A0A3P1SEU7_9ACTO|nr:serine/threonine-protein kinase [Schaalia canis]RRC95536.1 serine/threonine protein kinase [Schaalia canis]